MRKLAIGLLALAVIAGGAGFGVIQYSRWRAHAEVEKTFAALRDTGREASHGDVGYDLFANTLTVPDISVRAPDGATMRIASLVASGISQPAAGRVAARHIEVNGVAIEVPEGGGAGTSIYGAPRVIVEDYAGPDTLLPGGKDGSREIMRLGLRQLAAVSAARIAVPEATATLSVTPPGATPLSTNVTYTNLTAEGLAEGRIKAGGFDRMLFETSAPPDAPELAVKGRIDGFSVTGIDTAPFLALVDKEAPKSGIAIVYGRMSSSGYAIAHGDGSTMSVGGITAENVGLDPSILSLDRIDEMRALGRKGDALSADEAKRLYLATAGMTKGVAFTSFAMKDVAATDPAGKAKVRAVTLSDFKDGRLAAFSIEGLSGEVSGEKPVSLDKLVLKGVTPLPMMEMSSSALDGTFLALDGMLAFFRTLEGFELKGLSAPREDSDIPLTVKSLDVSWGQFIGLVPTRFALKGERISGPITEADVFPLSYLAGAGVNEASFDLDLALAYDPDARAITLSPASLRVDKALAASIDAKLTDVQRRAFEDPIAALSAAQQIGAGPIKLVITDLGLADLMLKENAAAAGISPEAMRAEVIAGITKTAKDLAEAYPEAIGLGEAVAAFVKAPGTLTLTAEPKGEAKLMNLIAADPLVSLREFAITATAGP